jgi:hypothetical protein
MRIPLGLLLVGRNLVEPFLRMAFSNNQPHDFLMSTLSSFSAYRRTSLVAFFTLIACLGARGGEVRPDGSDHLRIPSTADAGHTLLRRQSINDQLPKFGV